MDIIDRDALERRLARIVGRDLRSELDKLMDYLGNPPRLENVPITYWQNGWHDIAKDVEPVLMDIYLRQAEVLMAEISIGVDWGLVNTAAAEWSRKHGETVLKELFNTTYEGVSRTIPRFYEEGWNLGELRTALERWHSPVRAEMIAITETTRAAVEGERVIVDRLRRDSGIEMIPFWQTANDERVCPICGPKHGKPITDGEYPPAHPRCRCWVTYRMPEIEQ